MLSLPDGPAPTPPVLPPLTAADRDELDFRRQGLSVQVSPLEQQLVRHRVLLAQARLWQQALPALRQSFPAHDVEWQEWLTRFERRAAAVLRSEGGAAGLLELRLATLAFEMGEINRLLGDVPPAGTEVDPAR